MFDGKTAWFSSSVHRRKKKLWRENGGQEGSLEDAKFLFSEDSTSDDTLRVFESESYLDEHLAVFHPNYIKQCVKLGNIKRVRLGHYFFPPQDVQEIARKSIQYKWDADGNNSDGTDNESDEDIPVTLPNDKRDKPTTAQTGTSTKQNQSMQHNQSTQQQTQVPGKHNQSAQNQQKFPTTKDSAVPGPSKTITRSELSKNLNENKTSTVKVNAGSAEKLSKPRTPEKTPTKQVRAKPKTPEKTPQKQDGTKTSASKTKPTGSPITRGMKRKLQDSDVQNVSNNSSITQTQKQNTSSVSPRKQHETVGEFRQSPRKQHETSGGSRQSPRKHETVGGSSQSPRKQQGTVGGSRQSPRKHETMGGSHQSPRKHETAGGSRQSPRKQHETVGGSHQKQVGSNIINQKEDEEYLRLEDMAEVTGELKDFILGKNGCDLVKIW